MKTKRAIIFSLSLLSASISVCGQAEVSVAPVHSYWETGDAVHLSWVDAWVGSIFLEESTRGMMAFHAYNEQGELGKVVFEGKNRTEMIAEAKKRMEGFRGEWGNKVQYLAMYLGRNIWAGSRRRFESSTWIGAIQQGRLGMATKQMRDRFEVRYYSPFEIGFGELSHKQIARGLLVNGLLELYQGEEKLVRLGNSPEEWDLFRGSHLVDMKEVTFENIRQSAQEAAEWLIRNVDEEGRLVYAFDPVSGKESNGNNMIRQWMSSRAMALAARYFQRSDWHEVAKRNIQYNLDHFYVEEVPYGWIEFDEKRKLGALATAALALGEYEWEMEAWRLPLRRIESSMESLWRPDGSFRTFAKPSNRNDNQNFYPGEALLWWAERYEQRPDSAFLQKFLKSVDYYQSWHRDNRNPAFIPWHTLAYAKVWRIAKEDRLKKAIFEMNDWLIAQQQTLEETGVPDTHGRFYVPGGAFGPPHASSTGVYLEGLVEAWHLAREVGDGDRAKQYGQVLSNGFRSALQLQFSAEDDWYSLPESELDKVRGGFRTTVYSSQIRCDNVQHLLQAMLSWLIEVKRVP